MRSNQALDRPVFPRKQRKFVYKALTLAPRLARYVRGFPRPELDDIPAMAALLAPSR